MKGMAAVATPAEGAPRGSSLIPAWARAAFLRLRPPQPQGSAEAAPAADDPDALSPNIYGFIFRHSWRQQLTLIAITGLSFPFYYYSLLIPKIIVNLIQHYEKKGLEFKAGFIKVHTGTLSATRASHYLVILCVAFLSLVFVNGGFKYYLNTFKGRLGERMLRRFRYQLYQRMLLFPFGHFQRNSPAQIIPMITAECDSLGGFIGEAIATPAYQGGMLVTAIYFMFVQNFYMGLAAISLYPVQGYVIPKLQRKVNQLARQRVRTIRQVADRVQESAAGIVDIQANDNARLYLAGFANLLGSIYDLRFEIFQRKFFVKFLNNFLNQLTPFFFFAIGGSFVLSGSLSVAALVAVLNAYKDLSSPWKELLDAYQASQDSRIKYAQIVEQFQPDGVIDARLQLEEPAAVEPLTGDLTVTNLTLSEDDKSRIVDAVSFSLPLGAHVAIVGQAGSGKTELGLMLARLLPPTGGRITIGERDIATLPNAVIGRRIGYVGATPTLFAGSLRDNLLLGLRHRPMRPAEYPPAAAKRRQIQISEAQKSGNIDFDIHADWTDYEAAGADGPEGLARRITEVLGRLDLAEDVYGFGLRSRLDPEEQPEAAARLVEARKALARRLAADGITHLVETYEADRFNSNASVAENLLFGTPIGPTFAFDGLADNIYVRQVLDRLGLTQVLVEAGCEVAETMVELFADLPAEHEFFEQYSFISAADLPEFKAILGRIGKGGAAALDAADRAKLLSLPFKLIPARHRLDVVDEALQARLLEARHAFRTDLPAAARQEIAFFDTDAYNAAASVQDNILFGKIAFGEGEAPVRIPHLLGEVLDTLDLRQTIIEVGLDYNVGPGGSRLSPAQRQKAALARALLKRPDLLILNEATTALDGAAQATVTAGLFEEFADRGIIWVLHRASLARQFDRILVLSNGRLQEQGGFADLDHKGSLMTMLVAAE
jgi:putative ABC transport system ATP-binding protein